MLILLFLYYPAFRNSIFAVHNEPQTFVVLIIHNFEIGKIKGFSPDPVCRNIEYPIKFLKEYRSDIAI